MTQPEGFLIISLSSVNQMTTDVSTLISEVILSTGNQCIENYDPNSKYRISKIVPKMSIYNITLPARDIWYMAFVPTSEQGVIKVDFTVVDNLPNNTSSDFTIPDTPDTPLPYIPDSQKTPSPQPDNLIPADPTIISLNMMVLVLVACLLIFGCIFGVYSLQGCFRNRNVYEVRQYNI